MRFKNVVLAVGMLFCSFGFSQEKERVLVLESIQKSLDKKDQRVLNGIRSLIEREEYFKAKERLAKYHAEHSKDAQINWLYGYVLHLNKKYKLSDEKYQQAMILASKNNSIKLDYARVLYERGKFKKAVSLLESLRNLDQASKAEGLIMLAKISYWQGNIDKCKRLIRNFRNEFPGSDKLDDLSVEMSNATATYIEASYEIQSDNQPLDYSGIKAKAGMYKSRFFSPKIEVENYSYTPTAGALIFKVSNQFYFPSIGLTATANAGTFSNDGGSATLFGLTVNKKLPYKTSVSLGYNINPVLGTIASTTETVSAATISLGADYENKVFLTNFEFNKQNFTSENSEDNSIKNYVFWIISQPIKISKVAFQIGYSYGYSDSEKILYEGVPGSQVYQTEQVTSTDGEGNTVTTTERAKDESGNDIVLSFDAIYNPYFTPKELESHSLLFVVNYDMFDFLEIGGKTNYGIEAQAYSPYLATVASEPVFGDFKTIFYPSESMLFAKYKVNSSFSVKATYLYQETFFYSRNNISVGAKYRF